jgi:hypothetical protein
LWFHQAAARAYELELPVVWTKKASNINCLIAVVEAVISELVSGFAFPCFAGKYREIRRIQTENDD